MSEESKWRKGSPEECKWRKGMNSAYGGKRVNRKKLAGTLGV